MNLTLIEMLVILVCVLIGVLVGYLWIHAAAQYNKKLINKAESEYDQLDALRAMHYNESLQCSDRNWPGL